MKTFYQLLGNTILATVTNMTVWFALIFFVFLETHSVTATSIISGIYLVTVAISGFWFGNLVDHYRKKQLMLLSGVISLTIYAIGFLIYLSVPAETWKDPASPILWSFIPLLLLGVIAGNIRGIALPTIITIMIPEEQRDKANGLAGTATGIAFLIVSAISGFLVGFAGMYWVLILAMIMMIASLTHLFFIPIPEREVVHTDHQPAKLDIRGTFAIISAIPGLLALNFFTTFNNFLGGVFMGLMDAYGLSLVSVEVWGVLWAILSCGFIVGGVFIAKRGLGKNPLFALFAANICIWAISSVFTIQPSIILLAVGMFIYISVVPFIEASEHTIIQKVVPAERQGRVFGVAQSVEMAASPLTTFFVGPLAELVFIPFMTVGAGVDLIGGWFGTGADRGLALVFTLTGIIGLCVTLISMNSKYYRILSDRYMRANDNLPEGELA
jgi:DHA3 family multidrug efflux protein-like MFS transporter